MKDFFVSYNSADRHWAEWIAWQLEEAGYSIIIQSWDFRPGSNFVLKMQEAITEAERIIAILSPNYLSAEYTYPEWAAAFRQDPKGERGILLPIRVRPCEITGLLGTTIHIDLVGIEDETIARERLLEGVQHLRRKPKEAPSFPAEHTVAKQERFPGAPPPYWNIPYPRNLFFTGREPILKYLYETLLRGKATVLALSQVITGLGGIGKTQVALEYAYRYRDEYRAVLWARADTRELLISDLSDIADLLKLPEKEAKNQVLAANAVKRWLDDFTDWLLILDNAEKLSIVREFIPFKGKGHVLLTTREQATGSIAQRVDIERMESEEGALFLLRRANIIKPDAPFNTASASDRDVAGSISQQMDGLPLALDQAGAYIEETACSLSDYLKLYKTQEGELLKRRGDSVSGHPEPAATTWSLSFRKIERANPASAELLRLCAFLYHDEIPEEIITDGAPELGPVLRPVAADPLNLNEALGELRKYSLIRRDTTAKTITIHRLVQVVLTDSLNEDMQRQWAWRTVRAVNRAFPDIKFATWERCQRYLPHALVCAALIEQWGIESPEAARLLHQAGYYLQERAQYPQAESLSRQALVIRERILRQQQLDMAESLNDLALLYRMQGKYTQAEPLCREALDIRREILGDENSDVAASLNNLALLTVDQAKYEEAEQLYLQTLRIREKKLDADHPDVAQSLNNLALLYFAQGKYTEAELFHKRARAIREIKYMGEHPAVAESLNNLAELYRAQGKYAQAEPLYQQALEIRRRLLGREHPDVATSLNSLASLYVDEGKYTKAEQLYLQALNIRELALGQLHPEVAQSRNDLALLYRTQGKYAQAEPLYQQALEIRKQSLGPDHPYVATSLNNLAELYRLQGKYVQAEQFYQQALNIREKVLGREHPDIAQILDNLGALYYAQGKYEQVDQLYQQALEIRERILGPNHLDVAQSLSNLAKRYRAQGKHTQAEQYYNRALEIRERILDRDHPLVAQTLNSLARLYREQGNYGQAAKLCTRALEIVEKTLEPDHPDVATSLNNLAELDRLQGKYFQAEHLYRRALDIRKHSLGPNHPEVAYSLNNLAELYRAQGKYAEAEELYQQALEIRERVLGLDHPHVAQSLLSLARLNRDQGNYDKAKRLYEHALEIRQALGSEHYHVTTILKELASLDHTQNKGSER